MLSIEQFREITINELSNLKFNKNKKFKSLICILNNIEFITKNCKTNPGEAKLTGYSSTKETHYQRELFKSKSCNLYFSDGQVSEINWLDLELPVELRNKSRKKCIDLIGEIKDTPILCELKFKSVKSNSSGDRPEYGIFELIIYYYFVLNNYTKLNEQNVHHKGCKEFNWGSIISKKPLLLLTANKNYWSFWFKKNTYGKQKTRNVILEIIDKLNKELNINLCLFETDNIFEKQYNLKKWKQITKI